MADEQQKEVATTAPSGALAAQRNTKKTVADWLQSDQFKAQVGAALPQHLTPERFVRLSLNALMRTPKLAECTQESIFKCMLDLSAMGLEPDGRRAHLIPFKRNYQVNGKWFNEMNCQLIIDYKGLVELAYRSGQISNIHADVVCENDEFDYDRGLVLAHRPNFKGKRGDPYCYYCRVVFKDGSETAAVMTIDEIEFIRSKSKAKDDGPWVEFYSEMAKKTVFRRLSKWIPLSAEFRDAIDRDEDTVEVVPERRGRVVQGLRIDLTAGSDDEATATKDRKLAELKEEERQPQQQQNDQQQPDRQQESQSTQGQDQQPTGGKRSRWE